MSNQQNFYERNTLDLIQCQDKQQRWLSQMSYSFHRFRSHVWIASESINITIPNKHLPRTEKYFGNIIMKSLKRMSVVFCIYFAILRRSIFYVAEIYAKCLCDFHAPAALRRMHKQFLFAKKIIIVIFYFCVACTHWQAFGAWRFEAVAWFHDPNLLLKLSLEEGWVT